MIPALTGTAAQWGLLGTFIVAFFTALGIWFKHGPDRTRASNETKAIEASEMEKVLADYGRQISDFRAEVHGYRNELQAVRGELWASDKVSQQRNDRISTMELIIELLISELERIDPGSIIVRQAKIMLKRASVDPGKSEALNTAELAVSDAKQTVRSAEHTVVEINVNEAKGGDK